MTDIISISGVEFGNVYIVFAGIAAVLAFLALNKQALRRRRHLPLLALRAAAIMALFMVLASPYTARREDIKQESTSILIINDASDSMSVYAQLSTPELRDRIVSASLGAATVALSNTTPGERTAIGDAVYNGILGSGLKNNAVVLVTDGNNNYGADPLEVAAFASRTNTRIFPLVPKESGGEIYIKDITGPGLASSGTEYTARVLVDGIGPQASYRITASVDGDTVLDREVTAPGEQEFTIKKVFTGEGTHHITAEVFPASWDIFEQNNVMRKTVKVIGKPRILLVGDSTGSPLEEVLDEIYNVDKEESLPTQLDSYQAVVLDDVKANGLDVDALRDFISSGGGLVVVGGGGSYDLADYYESGLENLLPVTSKPSEGNQGKQINVLILLDISGSTGYSMAGETKIDVEKAIAVKMVRDLSEKASVGVAAFNSGAYLIQPIKQATDQRALEARIASLQFGGGTYVAQGLRKARSMLDGTQGAKYVVLISDGATQGPVSAFNEATSMASDGIVIHSVGVGFDTDRSFMRGIAAKTGGLYFSPSDTERVKLVVGESEEKKGGEGLYMVLMDRYHFITENLKDFNVSIEDFNRVTTKTGSQMLAATSGGSPLLTVWRFGLGRVASLTLDDGSEWANGLYSKGNSGMVSSTVNWAVGDPLRDEKVRVECADTHAGDETTVIVRSDIDHPDVSVGAEEMQLSSLGESTYYLSYTPTEPGFVTISSAGRSCEMAVNYPEEYGRFGENTQLLKALASTTGGGVHSWDEMDDLVSEVSQYVALRSVGVSLHRVNMQLWFSLAALLLFFTDVAIRRLREIRKTGSGPGKKEEKARQNGGKTGAGSKKV